MCRFYERKDINIGAEDYWNPHEKKLNNTATALLSNGADVNAKDTNGRTPLNDAILHRQYQVADLLREHGGVE